MPLDTGRLKSLKKLVDDGILTEEEFAEWRSEKWAKDLVGNGRWGERMRVRWVNLREQEMKIADATKMRDQEMQRVVELAGPAASPSLRC